MRLVYRLTYHVMANVEGKETQEWPFYAFDVLMFGLCLLVYCLFSPKKHLRQDINSSDIMEVSNKSKV